MREFCKRVIVVHSPLIIGVCKFRGEVSLERVPCIISGAGQIVMTTIGSMF
jgi:hypothetical protein